MKKPGKKTAWVITLIIVFAGLSMCCSSPIAPTTELHVTPSLVEGVVVNSTVQFTASGGDGTYRWKLMEGVGEPVSDQGTVSHFTPRQKGVFKILVKSATYEVTVGGSAK